MKTVFKSFFMWAILAVCPYVHAHNVGLLIMATGKYIQFVEPLIHSANKHFCTDHSVTYFVFTDGTLPENFVQKNNVVLIEQKRLGWPHDTLLRCQAYNNAKDHFAHIDYLFACDADMLFVNTVGSEILSARVATQHPGFVGRRDTSTTHFYIDANRKSPSPHRIIRASKPRTTTRLNELNNNKCDENSLALTDTITYNIYFVNQRGTYETHAHSTAYVTANEGLYYFAGGFYGGSTTEFLRMTDTMVRNIYTDLEKNFIAVWHDESHLNRYFISNPPTKVLSPEYCYPESWHLPYKKRLLALDKNHAAMRV